MAISMYDASVPVFIKTLGDLDAVLRKGEAFAAERKIDPSVLINMRLAADMFPLSRQVQIATDNAKGPAARLAGVERPAFDDTETTFADLHARIAKTVDFLRTLTRGQFEGAEDRPIELSVRGNELKFRGAPYLFHFALPNFFFHVTTAYDILRHAGVAIGKTDYLGSQPVAA